MDIEQIKTIDLILKFLYNNLQKDKIVKKTSQNYFLDGKIIEPNKIKKIKKKVTKVFYKLKIGELEYLFIKDYPLNILINLGFVIGRDAEVYKITTTTDTIYYTIKENLEYIEEDIKKEEKIDVEFFKNKIYELNFKQPKYVATIKDYVLKKKNLNLNKIHFFNGTTIRAFSPNKYKHDFEVSEKLKIPLVSYIEGNFIKDSHIHLKDLDYILTIIKPYKIIKEIEKVRVFKENENELIKDISREYYLISNMNFINSVIEKKYIINTNKIFLQERLNKHNLIRISNPNGEIEFPIWRCKKEIITFPNINKLEEFSGVRLGNINSLKELFLICENGERSYFEQKYLRKEILKGNNFFEQNNKILYFSKLDDLIVSVNLVKTLEKFNKIEYLVYEEKLNSLKINMLENLIRKLIKNVLNSVIKENKTPKKNYNTSLLTKYLESVRNELFFYLDKVKIGESRNNILNIFISKLIYLTKFYKIFTFNELFLLGEISNISLLFLESFKKKLKELEDELNNFFEFRQDYFKYSINMELEKIIELLFKYSNNKFSVYFKPNLLEKFNFTNFENFINKLSINFLEKLPNLDSNTKLDKFLLKKDFPKNYDKILEYFNKVDINSYDLINLDNDKVKVKLNNISLSLESKYFKKFFYSNTYKEVYQDDFLLLFKNQD